MYGLIPLQLRLAADRAPSMKKGFFSPENVLGNLNSLLLKGKTDVDDDEVEYTVKVEDRKTDRRSQEDAAYDALKGGLRTFLRETFGTIDKELLARANGGA